MCQSLPLPVAESLEDRSLLTPVIAATKDDALRTDVDGDNRPDAGDTIRYTVGISNTGDEDALDVEFADTLDSNTTLVPGSVNVSPLAFNDSFSTPDDLRFEGFNLVSGGVASLTITDPASGLFANDVEFLGDSFSLSEFDSTSAAGGTVSVNANGTFTYDPPTGFEGSNDTFTYTIADSAGLSDTGTVVIDFQQTVLTHNGDEITINHVNDSNVPGDGSFESPHGQLRDADLDSNKSDRHIVYVTSGTTFINQAYQLTPGQRLLGEGNSNRHLIDTDQLGTITLPNVGSPTASRPGLRAPDGMFTINGDTDNEISNFDIDNTGSGVRAGIFAGNSDVTVNRVSITGGQTGIDIIGGTGTFTFTDVTVDDATDKGLGVSGATANVTFVNGGITSRAGGSTVKVVGGHDGTLTFDPGSSILATGAGAGDGLQFDDADGEYDFRGSVTLNGGDAGIDILGDSTGTFTFTNTEIDYTGSSAGINIQDNPGGTFTFGTGSTITATNGTGLQFDDADGEYDFRGSVTLNGGDAGIDILGDSAGTFTFTNTTIDNPTGAAFKVDDLAAGGSINFDGSINSTTGQELIDVTGTAIGSDISFNSTGTNAISGNGAGGIFFQDADGDISVTTPTTIINPANGFVLTGISVFNSGGSITFKDTDIQLPADGFNTGVELNTVPGTISFENLDIQVNGSGTPGNGMTGVSVFRAGTLNITGSNTIDITGGPGFELNDADALNITLESVSVANSQDGFGGGSGITLTDVGGGSFTVTGTTTVDGAHGAAGIGIDIDDAAGTFTFSNIDIDSTTLDGISIGSLSGVSGTVNINGGSVTNPGLSGARIDNAARVNLSNTTINGSSGRPAATVDVSTGSSVVTSNNGTFQVPAGNASGVDITTSGTGTFCLDATGNTATGAGTGFGVNLSQSGGSTLGITQSDLTDFGNDNPATSSLNTSGTITFDCSPTPLLAAPAPASDVEHETRIGPGKPTKAAVSDATANTLPVNNGLLTPAVLTLVVDAAIERWSQTGLDALQLAALSEIEFVVLDMADWYLGAANGLTVQLDIDGGGYGWFIDPTPLDDSEFAAGSATGMDLLTTVMHEMGHVLGLPDLYDPSVSADLMFGFLTLGERRTPRRGQAVGALPGSMTTTAFIGSPVNIGTLPAGKSVTITFDATVNDPFPTGVASVSNQGLVSGDNFADIVTDDPETSEADDSTITPIDTDEPTIPTLTISDADPVVEGTDVVFTVSLDVAPLSTVTVTYSTSDGSATAPDDYISQSNRPLTFAPGVQSQTVTVATVDDDTPNEPGETFFVNLTSATNALIGSPASGMTTIIDNDDPELPTISISDAPTIDEGLEAVFTVSLDQSPLSTVTLTYSTGNGSGSKGATAPDDFIAVTNQTLTFNPGQQQQTISVTTIDDEIPERTESFFVNLLSATNAAIGDSEGVARLRDNDRSNPPTTTQDCSAARPGHGVFLSGSTLFVIGTNGNDTLHTKEGKTSIRVTANGRRSDWNRDDISFIVMCGLRGRDLIDRDGDTRLASLIDGGRGPDNLNAGSRDDVILGGGGDDLLRGNEGNDTIKGGAGNDALDGEDGNDFLHGGSGKDRLRGRRGNDTLLGSGGPDELFGYQGEDVLFGGNGIDLLLGGSGNDILDGGSDHDRLKGESGLDLLIGGGGSDDLQAGSNDDILIGGSTTDLNTAALKSILAEWTSRGSRQDRLANIRGDNPANDRANGISYLSSSTILDDNARDKLSGDSGADWFFSSDLDSLRDFRNRLEDFDEI